MITKQVLKKRPVCKLAFELSASLEADEVHLLADFNAWQGKPFTKLKSGKWKLIQEVTPGHSYQLRYHVIHNGSSYYLNDDSADEFVVNNFGSENALIHC